jgi:cytosine/adenosine deaminase-related metal-dependent hydrolase
MRAAKECADKGGVTFTMHHNFTLEATKRDDVRFGGQHNLRSFAEKGLLGRRCSFVHMNVVRDDEMAAVVESGMSLVWQPGNFLFYGICKDVKSRMAELSAQGVTIACCVDAAKCWTFGDLDLIGYLVARMDGHFIPTTKILEMRTRDAARAASMEDVVGSLERGKRADIVIRDSRIPEMAPGLNVVQELLLGAQASTVRTVLVDGRIVYDDGHPTLVDGADIVSRARKTARNVLSRAGYTPRLAWPVVS